MAVAVALSFHASRAAADGIMPPTPPAGLAHFKGCKNLTILHLGGTQVSDEGLAHFKDCKNLMYLNLKGAKVTAKGVADFRAAVPGCKIEHDGIVLAPRLTDPGRRTVE